LQAGTSPASRLLPLLAAVVTAALPAAAAASVDSTRRLQSPSTEDIGRSSGAIADSAHASRLLPGSYWGGPVTASTGEQITVYVSNRYAQDPAVAQRWADFLASLIHGSELSSLVAYLAPQDEVSSICGQDALACYGASANLLVAPGDDPSTDMSAEAVVTHEYGHHVAAHRTNPPWAAVDYGTKRWASYENVCSSTVRGLLYPGAESLPRYELNPGEAFAETYRVLNQRAAGIAEVPWDIVSRQLYPDEAALAALRADITTPWQSRTTSTQTSALTKTIRSRTYTVTTPLDGTVAVTVRPTAKSRLSLEIDGADGTVLARGTGSRTLAATTTICGQRSLRIRVAGISGTGTFRLAVARP
jgi:hypothetical protein